ncbi:MAG: FkbM family methyltransferase [Alphaproteobacteria bacterium]|nr:FkbM family methyltransferase [Alphaproteobacteria bacterium]
MSFRLNADPSFSFRKIEKLFLAAKLFWRFPRSHGAWPKYEYLKPWIIDQRPAAVIDVGINIGQFLHLAYRLWPEAKIIGVEPTADLADKMATLYKDEPSVIVEACAASDHDGEANFHITKDSQNSSLLEPSESFVADRPDDGLLRTETVQLRRMDDILKDEAGPFFVKIDVQGAEMDVLRGFGDRLGDIETLIIEAPFEEAYDGAGGFDDIYRYLADRGMDYAGPLGTLTSKHTGRVRQEDAVFVKRQSPA